MMNKVLANQLWKVCLAYLDDIIVFSKTADEHLNDLRSVLDALSTAGLRLQPKKCLVGADSIKYLGHIIDGRTVKPDPDNIRAVSQVAVPKNVKQVRSFLGLCNYITGDSSRISLASRAPSLNSRKPIKRGIGETNARPPSSSSSATLPAHPFSGSSIPNCP